VMSVLLVAFASVVFIQIIAPKLADSPFYRSIAIHLRNGLYVNTVFDRTVRALYSHETESKAIVIESADKLKKQDWVEVKKLDKQLA
jgi:NAD(P)H-quinone oxidoreductase subunit 5